MNIDNVIRINDAKRLEEMRNKWVGGEETGEPVWVEDGAWDESAIPVRPWIARGYLMRGAVTVISGPGSAGKSSLMIGYACGLALGLPFHRMTPEKPMCVLTYNVEDDASEQQRRMSAALRQFSRVPNDLVGKVIRIGPVGAGTLLRRDPTTGLLDFTRAMSRLEEEIKKREPDVIILDPLVELHDAEENDNTALRAVMARMRTIAIEHKVAVVLLHHSRKGSGGSPGDPDTLRGASSIVGAARIVLTVLVMSPEEAKPLGISDSQRTRYFRVDGAKMNYAPIADAEWFERVEYELDNGEVTAAAVPWKPPSVFQDISSADCNSVLDDIAKGPKPGVLYAAHKRGRSNERWAGKLLTARFDMNDDQAAEILRQWLRNGVLVETTFRDPVKREERTGVEVCNAKRPS